MKTVILSIFVALTTMLAGAQAYFGTNYNQQVTFTNSDGSFVFSNVPTVYPLYPLTYTNNMGVIVTVSTNTDGSFNTNNYIPPVPNVNVGQTQTPVVQPLVLSPAQFSQVISLVESAGINANVPITVTNLQTIYIYRRNDGYFVTEFTLTPQ